MLSNKKSLLNFFFFLASFTLVSSLFLALDNSIRAQISNQNEAYSLSPIIKEVSDSVVNISVKGTVEVNNPLTDDPFFRRFFDVPPDSRRDFESAGSGVIVNAEQGLVITNHHVIENADEITITLLDNRTLIAEVIGSDSGSDIALLKVESNNLSEMKLGDSSNIEVGDFVLAIGNPFGLDHTVTSGIISGLGRTGINPDGYEDFIQTDASINPGNSGGALVNLNGELIGINSAILSGSGGNIGIGFAIPVNMARGIMDQLLDHGEVKRGLLGVSIASVTPEIAETYSLNGSSGAFITDVVSGSAAEKAGLKIGDVILRVNSENIEDAGSLRNTIGLLRPGDEISIEIIREEETINLKAILDELGANNAEEENEEITQLESFLQGGNYINNNDELDDFNGVLGILVNEIQDDSPSALRGLRRGDIITHINRQRINNISEAIDVLENANSIILQILRGNRNILILIR